MKFHTIIIIVIIIIIIIIMILLLLLLLLIIIIIIIIMLKFHTADASLVSGTNKLLTEATKEHNLFDFLSSLATSRAPFLKFLLTPTEHISG